MSVVGHETACVSPKKIGTLPVADSFDPKLTNEIEMFIPLLDGIDIKGKDITVDALLSQLFQNRKAPDFIAVSPLAHGRSETRRIWCSAALNTYLDFSRVGQVFLIEREVIRKNNGKVSTEVALGMTNRSPDQASP
ncbi:MAG: hypothetical protein U1D41_07845 [Nitrosomonas sp.]|uniref:hypothetical protein n=2 Tax=Nitrosomonas sp. TaxID=42353 RepID=UPI0027363C05|nr:hypothetical protein [Nitrosomonas sp.]MDP3664174.1 hypothetical protein [Nitrosomonas sp.]MDZ4106058.1 hypothetical protein [Nitrosomonas sp.]